MLDKGVPKISVSSVMKTEIANISVVYENLESALEYLVIMKNEVSSNDAYEGLGRDDLLLFVETYINHISSLIQLYEKAEQVGKDIIDTFGELDVSMAESLSN